MNIYETETETSRFSTQLRLLGLRIKDVPGDGNCLFRALADQMVGDESFHFEYRKDVVKYMIEHREVCYMCSECQ